MAKVIIYGFGVVGKNLFRFLLDSGIPYAIANDEIIEYYSDDVKMDYIENIDIEKDDIIAICTTHDAYKEAMSAKIENISRQKNISTDVCYYENIDYSSKYRKFLDKEKISSLLLNKSMFAELVSEIICNAKTKYEETKKERNEKFKDIFKNRDTSKNIFQDIYKRRLDDKSAMIRYPYFNTFFSDKSKDKEFGFREPIDWDLLQDPSFRAKNKLVCVFGNSQVHGGTLPKIEDTLPFKMEQWLNGDSVGFKVLNCAYNGGSILEEIVLYITLFCRLNPEFVITVSGYDFIASFHCDKKLIEKHAFFYKSYDEKAYADSIESLYPIAGDIGLLTHLDIDEVFESFFYRLKQFEAIVKMNGSKFVACLQPTLYAKTYITELEIENAEKYMKIDKTIPEKERLIVELAGIMNNFMLFCNAKINRLEHQINLNPIIASETVACFDDWIHLNGYGNELIAKAIAGYIKTI